MTPATRQPASPAQAANPVSNNWQVAMAGTAQVVIHSASIKQSGIDKHKSGRAGNGNEVRAERIHPARFEGWPVANRSKGGQPGQPGE
jgi:hypothetical protein